MSHGFVLEPKVKGPFYGPPAVVKYRMAAKSVLQVRSFLFLHFLFLSLDIFRASLQDPCSGHQGHLYAMLRSSLGFNCVQEAYSTPLPELDIFSDKPAENNFAWVWAFCFLFVIHRLESRWTSWALLLHLIAGWNLADSASSRKCKCSHLSNSQAL